ncbi:MAG: ComEC/Rec2 family competence protein [Gemmataceae bacterium]
MAALANAADLSPWHAPLVPVALAVTAGILIDRAFHPAVGTAFAALGIGLVGWAAGFRRSTVAGLPFLMLALAAVGALHHRQYRTGFAADDLGRVATEEPQLVRLRGRLADEPDRPNPPTADALRSVPHATPTHAPFEATALFTHDDWRPASGLLRLAVAGPLDGLHAGDELEVVGWLSLPPEPSNPGEWDAADHWLDRRVTAVLSVRKTADAVVRLAPGGWSFGAMLSSVRGWGRRTLDTALPPEQAGVAAALLLGDGSAMTPDDWDRYVRTGVLHALAISGQHLVVLAAFLGLLLRLTGVRPRRTAIVVALVLVAYALMTGGRPPAMRAAVQVAVVCGGLVLRRPVMPANALALAWLVVLLLQPTDVADAGCQMSFLCVVVLTWGTARWFAPREPDPLDALIEESRPAWLRLVRKFGHALAVSYGITLALGLVILPLAAARYHLVSFAGLVIGPPVVLCTSVALVAGFLLLATAAVMPPLVPPFAWATTWAVRACEWCVNLGDRLPHSHAYVGDVPVWWLAIAYPALIAGLMLPSWRDRWRWLALGGLAWIVVGLAATLHRPASDELRLTFLAVGHGGCTVIETPDGRVLLYDAGALGGPDLTRRVVAPFLWSRGVRSVDEVFVSHADLDHFNGLPALFERFPVGRVTLTPTFADKTTPGVKVMLVALKRRRIPVRLAAAGDVLTAGDVALAVLHPPPAGPPGPENVRSLVLEVAHAGHTILLTGDLEGAGLARVTGLPPRRIDVMMVPHHGSKAADPAALCAWCRPLVAVACQGPPTWPTKVPEEYESRGVRYLGTWPHGAVTLRSHRTGLIAETFKTRQRFVVRAGGAR